MIRHILTSLAISCLAAHARQYPHHLVNHQRIIGGENARDLNLTAPWLVHLSIRAKYEWSCAGTIISDKMILSAAHCFYWDRCEHKTLIGIYLNRFDNPFIDSSETNVDFVTRMSNVLVRDDYDPYETENDIAVVRLYGDDRFSHSSYVASLPRFIDFFWPSDTSDEIVSASFIAKLPSSDFNISTNSIYRAYGQGVTEGYVFPTRRASSLRTKQATGPVCASYLAF